MAQRRGRAALSIARLARGGRELQPVAIDGRTIATTFWGHSWCRNLERYSDFSNRLPRGRTYVRHGAVIDLRIDRGEVRALVSGTSVYTVAITIKPLARRKWTAIRAECAGELHSIVELLQGALSDQVMDVVTRAGEGLFPAPREISLRCSCPDWATMCKHVAAVLYGVGARLDHAPELLFTLRGVDPAELISAAVEDVPRLRRSGGRARLEADDLTSIFGVELESAPARRATKSRRSAPKLTRTRASPKTGTKTKVSKKANCCASQEARGHEEDAGHAKGCGEAADDHAQGDREEEKEEDEVDDDHPTDRRSPRPSDVLRQIDRSRLGAITNRVLLGPARQHQNLKLLGAFPQEPV